MVIESSARFAKRTADWLLTSKDVKGDDIIRRLAMFGKDHQQLVATEARKIREKRLG